MKIPRKVQKALADWDSVGYLYRDGLAVIERRRLDIDGTTATVELVHLVYGAVNFSVLDCARSTIAESTATVNRIVVHDTDIIATNAIDAVRVCYQNGSDRTKELGLVVTSVEFTNGLHRWQSTAIENVLSGRVTIQPNPYANFSYSDAPRTILAHYDPYGSVRPLEYNVEFKPEENEEIREELTIHFS